MWLALALSLSFPRTWERIVDGENDFWVRRGLVSRSVAEKFKRLGKGWSLKALIIFGLLMSVVWFYLDLFLGDA